MNKSAALELMDISKIYLAKLIKNEEINFIKDGIHWFFPFEEVLSFKNIFDNLKINFYKTQEIINKFGTSETQLNRFIREKVFKDTYLFKHNHYFLKKEVDEYYEKEEKIIQDNYTLLVLVDLLNKNINTLRFHVKKFTGAFQYKNKWYIPKQEVDAYISTKKNHEDNFLTAPQVYLQYGICQETLRSIARRFPEVTSYDSMLGVTFYSKEFIEAYAKKRKRIRETAFVDDPQDAYDYFLELSEEMESEKCLFRETISLYHSFAYQELKDSTARNLKDVINLIKPSLGYIIKNLTKEIFDYSNKEIEAFITNTELKISNGIILINFLKFCKKKKTDKCKFNNIPKRESKYDPSEGQETIPETIFMKYYDYVTEMENNVRLAIGKPKHAHLWVYIMVHMFEAWRASDVIHELPFVNLDAIKVYSLDFFASNTLTITQAQIVLNQYYLNEFIMNKTGAVNGFNVLDSMIVPLSTALVICELHRRRNKEDRLLYSFKIYRPIKEDYIKFFGGNKNLGIFGNLKACRTLLTLFHDYIAEESDCQEIAHEVARRLRGHKKRGKFRLTDTTSIYIQDRNNDSGAKNTSKHIFERGIFGWLYYILLSFITDSNEFQKLPMQSKTKMIVDLQAKQSPYQIEGFGKYLLTRQQNKVALIEELRSMPIAVLFDKFKKIFQGLMPADLPETQCFKYGECPHKLSGDIRKYCKRCEYLIPNKYFLISLKEDIYDLINSINALEDYQVAEKLKLRSVLECDMYLLQDALDEECGLGEETVDAFIDREDLRSKLYSLK